MSLVTFLGIYFVREARIDVGTVGLAFLVESLLRGVAAPMLGALSDRIGRRALLIAAALATAIVLPSFLLVSGPASLFAWSVAMGLAGAINMPVATALLLDLAPAERRRCPFRYRIRRICAGRDALCGCVALAACAPA
jgi:MFS family permease